MLEKDPLLKKEYSWKFYLGVALVILSVITGIITKILMFVYLNNPLWFWVDVFFYLLSWVVLIIGAWWIGKEYVEKIKRYANYKFYQESIKKGTTKMYRITREKTHRLRENAHAESIKFRDKARNQRDKVKIKLQKVRNKSPFRKKV
ncbi:MAG: hypothetical protein V2A62_04055 [Candidatus Woesearchaeota archaeon]